MTLPTGLGLNNILSSISMACLPNPPSLSPVEYHSSDREIRLTGPNEGLPYHYQWYPAAPFTEFHVLPLTNIRELHLGRSDPSTTLHPSSFPILEIPAIECSTDVYYLSYLFSVLFLDPSSFPLLKILSFFNCIVTDGFVGELTRFSSNRKNTASAWLHHVLIVH